MKNLKYLSLILLTFLFSSCQTMAPIVDPDQQFKEGKSLVIGHIIINDTEGIGLRLMFKNVETGKGYYIEKWNHIPLFGGHNEDGSGYFAVNLPPGRYECFRLVQEGIMSSFKNIELYFDVVPSSTVYVGSLIYSVTNLVNVLYLVGSERVGVAIDNNKDDAVEYFKAKGYKLGSPIVESILRKRPS